MRNKNDEDQSSLWIDWTDSPTDYINPKMEINDNNKNLKDGGPLQNPFQWAETMKGLSQET